MCNRACSALTQLVNAIKRKKVIGHATFQTKVSGQLLNLGSCIQMRVQAARSHRMRRRMNAYFFGIISS